MAAVLHEKRQTVPALFGRKVANTMCSNLGEAKGHRLLTKLAKLTFDMTTTATETQKSTLI